MIQYKCLSLFLVILLSLEHLLTAATDSTQGMRIIKLQTFHIAVSTLLEVLLH